MDAYSFIQNSAWEDRRAGDEAELRFLVNYNLLFGMRGITWYTWAAGGSVTQSAIAEDGTKTDSYYSIQNIDADLKAMKGVYMDFDQDGFIFHNTPIDRTSLMYRNRAHETLSLIHILENYVNGTESVNNMIHLVSFSQFGSTILLYFMGAAVFIGILGSVVAIRKHLKV